jgi:hypothetical protein
MECSWRDVDVSCATVPEARPVQRVGIEWVNSAKIFEHRLFRGAYVPLGAYVFETTRAVSL